MNNMYFEYYGQYMIAPFVTVITGASLLLFAIITLILAICLFGSKNRGLYAVNKTMAVIGLVVSILLTIVYAAVIGLVAISPELFSYQQDGVLGAIRDLTCGIFLAPSKFGLEIDLSALSTRLPFIFYTITVFAPAVFGFIVFIVSCVAQRSSRKARSKAVASQQTAPSNIPQNVNQPMVQPVSQPVQNPAPVPVPAVPVQSVQDNAPVDEAPIQKLVPETAQAPFEAENTPSEVTETPTEVAETPAAEEDTPAEAENTPSEATEAPTEVAETPAAEEDTPAEAESTSSEVTETPTEVAETPVAAETTEKPIDEAKILNLVATPPAENTLSNDKPLFCMNCGCALNGGAFCMNCGTPARTQSRLCKSCNAELAGDARFCMVCGTRAE